MDAAAEVLLKSAVIDRNSEGQRALRRFAAISSKHTQATWRSLREFFEQEGCTIFRDTLPHCAFVSGVDQAINEKKKMFC